MGEWESGLRSSKWIDGLIICMDYTRAQGRGGGEDKGTGEYHGIRVTLALTSFSTYHDSEADRSPALALLIVLRAAT